MRTLATRTVRRSGLGLAVFLSACGGALTTVPGSSGDGAPDPDAAGVDAAKDTPPEDAAAGSNGDGSDADSSVGGDTGADANAPPEGGDGGDCLAPPAGIVSWWPADGLFSDLRGGNDGVMVGSVPFVDGEVAQAFFVAGATNWVAVPDAPNLELTTALTIEAWIDPVATGGRIVDKITAYGVDGYMLDTYMGRVRLIIGSSILMSSAPIPTGKLSHVAGTFDGATLNVYLNGEPSGAQTYTSPIPTNSLRLSIGADSSGGSNFDGIIDEVTIYLRALGSAEIKQVYLSGTRGKCKS